jgi:hypothetical protein
MIDLRIRNTNSTRIRQHAAPAQTQPLRRPDLNQIGSSTSLTGVLTAGNFEAGKHNWCHILVRHCVVQVRGYIF